MPRIFISYRRQDAAPYAGRIFDRLTTEFGRDNVFMDIDSLDPGVDFVETIEQTVRTCHVFLAVIGRQWLEARDDAGQLRLANPEDFVALEIGAALQMREIRVVPVLVGGARMPRSTDLPAALTGLARKHALDLPDVGFHTAIGRLIESIPRAVAVKETAIKETPRIQINNGLEYVWIPPGSFTMGCSPGDTECFDDESPPHQVTISKGFWLGRTPVTQEAWERVMGSNPSHFKGPKRPVERVSWDDAQNYCKKVGLRLPTEAEWEYAARAGSNASRYGDLDQIAWYAANSQSQTHEVALKQPNAWGLCDMLGNVWEWTSDWYAEKYAASAQTDPQGPASGTTRVVRGGGWYDLPRGVRASVRGGSVPGNRDYYAGLRCAGEFR